MNVTDGGEGRDHLRLASSRPFVVLDGSGYSDPVDEPLADGTPRPALTSIAVRVDGDRLEATTTLALNGRIINGQCIGDASDRTAIVASATLGAVAGLLDCSAVVESALIVDVAGIDAAVTILRLESNGNDGADDLLVGSALVRGDSEDATARSVLSALNRRISR